VPAKFPEVESRIDAALSARFAERGPDGTPRVTDPMALNNHLRTRRETGFR
jgi:hypothetical protein